MKKTMKKTILLLATCLMMPVFAQIKLEENKTSQQKSKKQEYIEISNFGKYQANVIAFAMLCKFPEEGMSIINKSYFSKLFSFNLTQDEKNDLSQEYRDEFQRVVDVNINKTSEELSCSKFKVEYEKIVDYVKGQK